MYIYRARERRRQRDNVHTDDSEIETPSPERAVRIVRFEGVCMSLRICDRRPLQFKN